MRFLAGLFLFLAAAVFAADNWPRFRGADGSGISTAKNLPDTWAPDKNILWKIALPGRGHSSPVVWGDRIFLTADIEGDVIPDAKPVRHDRKGEVWIHPDSTSGNRKHTLKVLAIDTNSGKIVWERTSYEGQVVDDRHRKNTYASPTPVTDGKLVYAFFEAEGLYAYDFEGQLAWTWKVERGKIAKMGLGPGTSPVLHDGLLYLQCDNEDGGPGISFVVALDAKTGKEVWKVQRDHRKTHATPLIVKRGNVTELVTNGWETIISYDATTGKELWRTKGVGGWAIPSPVANGEMVFLASGYPAKTAIGVKLGGSGDLDGTEHVAWTYKKGTAYVTSPILYGDHLYLVSDKGMVTCMVAKTGEVLYDNGRVPVPASFSASAIAFDGKLFLTSEDGDTFVVKAGPEFAVLGTNSVGEPVLASPAIAGGRLYIRGAQHLFAIGAR